MVYESLKPGTAELFRQYRESHREIFLGEIQLFIRGANHTKKELAEVLKACVERGRALRAPSGGRRGRPRGSRNRPQQSSEDTPELSKPGRPDSGQSILENEFEHGWAQHGSFRTVCGTLRTLPGYRPFFLQQILVFIRGADKKELAEIRQRIAKDARIKRPRRGQPEVHTNENIMATALRVAWMRHVDGKKWLEIASVLPEYSPDEKFKTLRNLEDYVAAAIWRAIPASCIRETVAGREIAPGALDRKKAQAYIQFETGLPFISNPEQCKKIVTALWERGMDVGWKRLYRCISRTRKPPVDRTS